MRGLVKVVCIALVLSLVPHEAEATAQSGDRLMLGSDERWIETNPLEPFFETHPELKPKSEVMSTALWRGYLATWEITEGRLSLTDIQVLRVKEVSEGFDTEFYSAMSAVFPEQTRVLADWFTGHIVAPSGELLEYVHMGYASTYERYTLITVVKGLVEAEREMSARQFRRFRRSQFRKYKRTDEFVAEFNELKDDDDTVAEIEDFLFDASSARYTAIIFSDGAR